MNEIENEGRERNVNVENVRVGVVVFVSEMERQRENVCIFGCLTIERV